MAGRTRAPLQGPALYLLWIISAASGCSLQLSDLSNGANSTPTPSPTTTRSAQWIASDGSIYIADTYNCVIRKVDGTTGNISTVAGDNVAGCSYSGDGGPATSAQLNYPLVVALDTDNNLYIGDSGNLIVRKVDANTQVITTVAGIPQDGGYTGDGGLATAAKFNTIYAMYVDASNNIYVSDGNSVVRKITHATGLVSTVAGTGNWAYSGDGGLATAAELNLIGGISEDSAGNLYLADVAADTVRKISATTGIITTIAGDSTMSGSTGDGGDASLSLLNLPTGVAIDSSGHLYIADTYNYVIRKVDKDTNIIDRVAGLTSSSGTSGDGGPALSAEMDQPGMIAFDEQDNLYIVDTRNHVVRKISASTGDMTTIVGTLNSSGYSGDGGTATSALLYRPSAVALTYD